jgi:sRNA-binding protein
VQRLKVRLPYLAGSPHPDLARIHFQNNHGGFMAQDRNTYAKRQRENAKKQKAEDKRARRRKRQELASGGTPSDNQPASGQSPVSSVDQ